MRLHIMRMVVKQGRGALARFHGSSFRDLSRDGARLDDALQPRAVTRSEDPDSRKCSVSWGGMCMGGLGSAGALGRNVSSLGECCSGE